MNYKNNKSKGFKPIPSGPNMTGYYLGNKTNLLSMMQEGGMAPRLLGDVTLARALQRRSDSEKLEDYQRKEAERQKRGRLFGGIGGLAGGLLGAALAPATGGASLALLSGLGTALGKGVGTKLGAGDATDVDTTGTVYGQELFRDVERAGEEFDSKILEDALVSGAKAGLTAGFSPSGSIYGKAGGKFRTGEIGSFFGRLRPSTSLAGPVVPSVNSTALLGDILNPSVRRLSF